jgi:hypothetical protein
MKDDLLSGLVQLDRSVVPDASIDSIPALTTSPVSQKVGERKHKILRSIFRAYRGQILLTYALFVFENFLDMTQPFILGLAIDGLLEGSIRGLVALIVQQIGYLSVGVARRAYDTRIFSHIHAELVTKLVLDQRQQDIEISRVSARSALSREFADFFEQHIPVAIRIIVMMIGGLAILYTYDLMLVLLAITLMVPATVLNLLYARRSLILSAALHDTLEREVEVIHRGDPDEIRIHYLEVARCKISLSDSEARNFGAMELFVMALVAAALVRSCNAVSATPGEILAVLRYVYMFVVGLDGLPILIQKFCRLSDVGRRFTTV